MQKNKRHPWGAFAVVAIVALAFGLVNTVALADPGGGGVINSPPSLVVGHEIIAPTISNLEPALNAPPNEAVAIDTSPPAVSAVENNVTAAVITDSPNST